MTNREEQEISVQGSSLEKDRSDNISKVIWKPRVSSSRSVNFFS